VDRSSGADLRFFFLFVKHDYQFFKEKLTTPVPWSRFRLMKLMIAKLVQKFPAFHGT